MGTHISKVKSVDLDVWTPEQMESIQKWGNRLANLYWEAHLKPGHIPPEHKMESFIRSKYESRRWALEGPPPSDPSVLDSGPTVQSVPVPQPAPSQQSVTQPTMSSTRHTHAQNASISARGSVAPPITTRQPQVHQLISSNFANRPAPASLVATPSPPITHTSAPFQPPVPPGNDLFSLDFHAPTTPANSASVVEPKKDVKQDILSLFSAAPASASPAAPGFGQFNAFGAQWGGTAPPQQLQQQPAAQTSMVGGNGVGMWGASSGWTGTPAAPVAQPNIWNASATAGPQQTTTLFDTNAVWGGTASPMTVPSSQDLFRSSLASQTAAKKDDAFGDIWGGFK
ncbi:hypothetical protein NLJ89_g6300 [Agrocybe chaxingu]|uniref:Arf-GAP domain-containing protein n=1 Tax=Agrocybe chaxingu TaxID=84603 RepID=A0A9W8JZE7_9AGAR|nr:hypothetical protein NLJ89_g6300 [Agrocybe chaxingu]